MSASFGASVLSVFDFWGDEEEFLSQLIQSPDTPAHEARRLVDTSILANSEDFYYLIDCARSIQRSKYLPCNNLDGNDVLSFVWHVLASEPTLPDTEENPWAETDRLIILAKELATDPDIRGPTAPEIASNKRPSRRARRQVKPASCRSISHYWSAETSTQDGTSNGRTKLADGYTPGLGITEEYFQRAVADIIHGIGVQDQKGSIVITSQSQKIESAYPTCQSTRGDATAPCPTAQASPFFALESRDKKFSNRPPAGVVASVPFPPLSSSQFGLIQERLAHEPFWLLIAVTFLIKTSGQAAIPVFHKVRERFPSPKELSDPSNADELFNMIRHLGLAANRLGFIQKYAEAFVSNPPAPGKQYRVRNYEKRDVLPFAMGKEGFCINGDFKCVNTGAVDGEVDAAAWEIGHMTQGKYTLDSWRIFCRDELLGRAQDWNGKGQQPEFQPEWMRVMPHDKELRAYLRWMWMREGWEWDPETGERQVLRPELEAAVNEGRVEYDKTGGLRILETARQ
ncbi:methyl-CpG-binding domain-containing protein 4 [Metarhizium album ARSEF 1941]|uniref:Methyl-CpG-binding domain-containing protein 4 n=1 Tax=Metarhizium album (strain ARSEF 1941) TaxID=1081103 RepID=A0A0B2X3K2_METAS|nr:methyl-CpG-binding domain-containing protein 4 [Metarhizium album ARSEF 1941]KHO00005.1 methyl-CpG-binding domain-containing protein 4 [Metarhizium album ARSEF 1941]